MATEKTKRILYVEDDVGAARLLQKRLKRVGYDVEAAPDGAEGLSKWRTGSFDMLAVDHDMPVMTGLEMIRTLAAEGPLPPTVMITGAGNEAVAVEAMKLGAEDYIIKDSGARYLELIPSVIERALAKNRLLQEKQHAETGVLRANRALRALSDCNRAVARATDELALMQEVCRVVVEDGGYKLVWVGFAEHDEQRHVRPVAKWGQDDGYLDTITISWGDSALGSGPTGRAIRDQIVSVVRNVRDDPVYSPWRSEALKQGFESSIALPLIADGTAFGALNIHAMTPDAFDAEEIRLFGDLADNLAYGIVSLRARTDRINALQELSESEEKLRLLTETIGDFFWMGTPGMERIVYASPAYERIWGRTRTSLYQNPSSFTDAIHPEDRHRCGFSAPERKAGRWDFEYRIYRPDNEVRWIHERGFPVHDETGRLKYVSAVAGDITDRKQFEVEREQDRRRLKSLWRLSGMTDLDHQTLCGRALDQILELTNSEYAFLGFVDPKQETLELHSWSASALADCELRDKPIHYKIQNAGVWVESLKQNAPFVMNDYTVSHPGKKGVPPGHVAVSRLMSVPLVRNGRYTALACVANKASDYTEDDVDMVKAYLSGVQAILDRKKAEDTLLENQSAYKAVLENLGLGVAVVDKDRTITFANHKRAEMLGVTVDRVIGEKCFRAFRGRETMCKNCPGTQAMTTRKPVESGGLAYRPDGTKYKTRIHAVPLIGRDGEPLGYVEVVTDAPRS